MEHYEKKMNALLDAPAYSLAEAARLAGLSKDRVRRWLQGYKFTYEVAKGTETRESHQDAVVKRTRTKDTYVSFLELVDLLFVKRFLDEGYHLQTLRKAFNEARLRLGISHFANSRFFSDGRGIYLEMPEDSSGLIALMTGGQWTIAPIIKKLSQKIDFNEVSGIATRWYPLGKKGRVVVDPRICFGRPTIIGRGIATENIYDLFLGEKENSEAVSNWLKIPEHEVRAAISFEQRLYA